MLQAQVYTRYLALEYSLRVPRQGADGTLVNVSSITWLQAYSGCLQVVWTHYRGSSSWILRNRGRFRGIIKRFHSSSKFGRMAERSPSCWWTRKAGGQHCPTSLNCQLKAEGSGSICGSADLEIAWHIEYWRRTDIVIPWARSWEPFAGAWDDTMTKAQRPGARKFIQWGICVYVCLYIYIHIYIYVYMYMIMPYMHTIYMICIKVCMSVYVHIPPTHPAWGYINHQPHISIGTHRILYACI